MCVETMRGPVVRLVILVVVAWTLCTSALGQAAARLDGTVKDVSGAVVPGVTITLTNQSTNLTTETLSNRTGRYIFLNTTPGAYTLEAELIGFKRFIQRGITLVVGETATIDVLLQTGEINEVVTVTDQTPVVDRVSQSIRQVVTEKQLANLPLSSRDPMNLFYMMAGTSSRNGGRVDGLRNTTSNVQIEGIAANDAMLTGGATQSLAPLIVEAIAEYSVTTSSAAAEAGLGGGAQVQVMYKSGTNDFHGSVSWFHRNRALNANNFFRNRQGLDKPAFRRHVYGFAIGGPVIRDRAFFHFTYEKETQVEDDTILRTVWTDRFKQTGVFQYRDTVTGDAREIDLKTLDPTRTGMSAEFTSYANLLPSPNNNDVGDGFNTAGYRYSSDDPLDNWRLVLKGDYIFNEKHRMAVSYADRRQDDPGTRHILGHRNSTNNEKFPAGIFTLTSTLTPTLLNEFRMGGTKRDWKFSNGDDRRFETAPLINFDSLGGTSRGGNANRSIFLPQAGPSATLTFNDNVTWIMGDHTFKGGVDIRINRSNVAFGGDYYIPVVSTSNSSNPASIGAVSGISSSDRSRAEQLVNDITATIGFLRQDFQQITPSGDAFVPFETKLRKWRSREYSFFFQDTWKFNPRLTLQMGLRYELLPPHFEANGIFSYPVSGGLGCVECLWGISGPGETTLGLLPNGGKSDLYETSWSNFAPNLGFTWDPTGSGKWSLATNYRISYDRNPLVNTLFQDFSQEGAATTINVFGTPGDRLSSAEAISLAIDPGAPFGPKPFNRQGLVTVWEPSYRTPYVQSWSLRIQREVWRDTLLEAAYVGNHGTGLARAVNVNQIIIRENGFLDGFLAAQQNLATNGDPMIGPDTGVFGQIWCVLRTADRSAQLSNISRGEVAAVADFIDRSRASRNYLEAAGLPLNFFRANPQFQDAWLLGNNSHSTYHGLKLSANRRFSHGLQFRVNYSLSKALTDYEGGQSQRNHFRDNANRKLDKTRSGIDTRHVVNATFMWEVPVGRGRRFGSLLPGVLQGILGHWQINGRFAYVSSQPLTVASNGRNNLTMGNSSTVGFAGSDPAITSSVNKGDSITAVTDEQKALFSHPAAGSVGLTAERFFSNAPHWVLHGSVLKSFRTPWFAGEESEWQLRFEFFNLTNSTRFNDLNTDFDSASFGNITSSEDARIMQVALKFIF